MKYSKSKVRELLNNRTHILKMEHTEEFTELVKELYPKDRWFEVNSIKHVGGHYLITSRTYVDEWYWVNFELEYTVILFSEIEKDEVVWLGKDMQFLDWKGEWRSCASGFKTKYRLAPNKSDKELEL